MCPRNLLGTFDVYHTSRHGTDWAGSPALVHAVHPRIAIMNNGAMKGGTKGTFEIVRSAPGIEDFWQLHYSMTDGKDLNSPEQFIATKPSPESQQDQRPIAEAAHFGGAIVPRP